MFKTKKAKEYFMHKEIFEQKEVFNNLCSKFIDENSKIIKTHFPLKKWNRIFICASGSSKNAGEIAKYFIEGISNIPCSVEYASEFAHKETVLTSDDLFIVISQSGNTADTHEALLKAKANGVKTFALTNNETSKIHKLADYKILADAGVENSIAATKSFTAQLLILYLFAMALAEDFNNQNVEEMIAEFEKLPQKYEEIFTQEKRIKQIAKKIKKTKSIVLLARNINSALAKEGGLKIKETCYINAISAPAGEFMHGHFAFLDKHVPIIGVLNRSENDEKIYKLTLNNLSEIRKKRKTNIILLKTVGDKRATTILQNKLFIDIPKVNKWFVPFLNLVALQLLAYETAILIHDNIDKPRDLKKCVETE